MNHLALRVIEEEESGKRLQILIDGVSFLDRVRVVELPYATWAGTPRLAGKYAWLRPYRWAVDALGVADLPDGAAKVRVLLQCGCEVPGCWPLTGEIGRRDGTVVWRHFENCHRGPDSPAGHWRHDRLGPFVFALEPYQAEIAGVVTQDDDE